MAEGFALVALRNSKAISRESDCAAPYATRRFCTVAIRTPRWSTGVSTSQGAAEDQGDTEKTNKERRRRRELA